MITLFVWCIVNGLLCHFNVHDVTEDIKMLIVIICIASDLNLFATFSRK